MPELPEVETTRRGLAPHVEGRRVTTVTLRRPDLRWPIPAEIRRELPGRRIAAVRRRAKYLLLDTEAGDSAQSTLTDFGGLNTSSNPATDDGGVCAVSSAMIVATACSRAASSSDVSSFFTRASIRSSSVATTMYFRANGSPVSGWAPAP